MEATGGRHRLPLVAAAPPLVTAALLLLHPTDPVDPFELRDRTGVWLTVHVGLLALLPAVAGVLILSVGGLSGAAAAVARAASVAFAAWYAAFVALVGIATGVLVREADHFGDAGDVGALVATWWAVPAPIPVVSVVAIVSWLLAAGGAALAHHRAGSPRLAVVALAVAAVVFGLGGHPGVVGAIGMASLGVALIVLSRQPSRGGLPMRPSTS